MGLGGARKGAGAPKGPNGRKKGAILAHLFAKAINEDDIQDIARMLLRKAIDKQDISAAKEILDRLYGKAPETVDHTSGGDKIKTVINLIRGED